MVANLQIKNRKKAKFKLRPASFDDLGAILHLLNKCAVDQVGKPNTTKNELYKEWTTPKFNLTNSTRVVETRNGQIVGYVEVWDIDQQPVSNWVWGRVDPDFEGLGIGTKLMTWAERRLQQTLLRVPQDLRVCYRSSSLSTHEPTKHLLATRKMTLVRHFWRMIINLDEMPSSPAWPDGISLQTLSEFDDLRSVYRAFNDAFRDHWGYIEQPEDDMVAEWEHWLSADTEIDKNLWFLAMEGKEIAAVCLCRRRGYDDPEMGWVNILGVRRPWRKRGLGLALLHHAFGEFYRRGKKSVGLGVDAANLTGATRLYERAGMSISREFLTYEKELRPGRDISKQS